MTEIDEEMTLAVGDQAGPGLQSTPKIPPSFDGRSSWFACEEAVDDWVDITALDPEEQGPRRARAKKSKDQEEQGTRRARTKKKSKEQDEPSTRTRNRS